MNSKYRCQAIEKGCRCFSCTCNKPAKKYLAWDEFGEPEDYDKVEIHWCEECLPERSQYYDVVRLADE